MTLYPFTVAGPNNVPQYGFVDRTGRIAIEPVYYSAFDFREDRASVRRLEPGWGAIDVTGREIVECKYNALGVFAEGRCAVRAGEFQNEKWGFVDENGELVIDARIRQQWAVERFPFFAEGLCAVPSDDGERWGYIDPDGHIVIAHQFAPIAGPFSDGLAAVTDTRGRVGYIDRAGAFVIAPKWKSGWPFVSGLAAVRDKTGWGVIDRRGEYVQPAELVFKEPGMIYPTTDALHFLRGGPLEFHDERALVQAANKKWGYLGPTGEVAIEATFERAGFFGEGRAFVAKKIKGKLRWGVIDRSGARVVDFAIEHVGPHAVFANGLAPVGAFGKASYVRTNGEPAFEGTFDFAGTFRDGLARVLVGGRTQYIDVAGRVVFDGA